MPINILPGFPTTNASTTTDFPFGIFFADANTLYVADEGNGNIGTVDTTNAYDDALTQNGNPGDWRNGFSAEARGTLLIL